MSMTSTEQSIFVTLPIPGSVWDNNLRVIDCNESMVRFLAARDKNDAYKKLSDERFFSDKIKSVMKNVLTTGHHARVFWERLVRDEVVPVETTFTRVFEDEEYYVVCADTDQRQFFKAEEQSRIMLDAAPISIILYDRNGDAKDCSLETMRMFGLSGKHELDHSTKLMPPFQPNGHSSVRIWNEHFARARSHGVSRANLICQKLDGTLVQTEAVWASIGYQGEKAVIEYLIDQTEKMIAINAERESHNKQRALEFQLRAQTIQQEEIHRREVAEESSRAKTRFLARMSHEIRTPISSVLGISEIQLQSTNLSAVVEEAFAKIHASATSLLDIVSDILDLSKFEAGKMSLVSESYEIVSLISDAIGPHLNNISDKGIGFSMKIDPTLPISLLGDAVRIKQVINNLLSNSFKYTEKGSIKISIRRRIRIGKEVMLEICVADTGLGMNAKQLEALQAADEYMRFHEQEMKNVVGTGLGMPIVSSLLHLMGGSMNIESEVGVGTTVTVAIPQGVKSGEPIGNELAAKLQSFELNVSSAMRKFKFDIEPMPYGRVLVVDDVEANLYVAHGLLSFYGLHIKTCLNGFEALECINNGETYDIIFMDQMMPGMDGIETMKQLRGVGYDGIIVALTANALIGHAEKLISMGFDGFLSKPVQIGSLNSVLTKYIRDNYPEEERIAAINARGVVAVSDVQNFQKDPKLLRKLKRDFVKRYKNVIIELTNLLEDGDLKAAHILVHTIKGSAGLINEHILASFAQPVENILAKDEHPSTDQLTALSRSVTEVLLRIDTGADDEVTTEYVDRDAAFLLFDKLEPMLASKLAASADFADELRAIPDAAIIARQIEEYDFALALKNIQTLRSIM